MSLSLKCQYAVRALFELAKSDDDKLIRLKDIAKAQHIPHRFLENILNELRQGGFVQSKRGKDGGFRLNRPPEAISVGDVVRFIERSVHPVDCMASHLCPLTGKCIFFGLWEEAKEAIERVYDNKKLSDLVREDAAVCHAVPGPPLPDPVEPPREQHLLPSDSFA
ncbi:MAG: Rrf2 family transcriptional regulator [Planctomycetes bacterium]|nr:Rrf2 family transcriptional regulator [Planctomycetota bacterium]